MTTTIQTAEAFALSHHDEQRHGNRPYRYHLSEVIGVLGRFGIDTERRITLAWLHDTVEDTDVTLDDIESTFDSDMRILVDAVTDVTVEQIIAEDAASEYPAGNWPDGTPMIATNRAERKRRTFAKTRKHPDARLVKFADRIANVEFCYAAEDKGHLGMYRKEHELFRQMLYDVRGDYPDGGFLEVGRMQQYLNHLLMKVERF